MTERALTPGQIADAGREASVDAWLGFLAIGHPQLPTTIRVVSDVLDYQWDGHLWTGVPFMPRPVTDRDAPPSVELRMQNVDRAIGQALRRARGRARVSLWVLSSADFDLGQIPRVAKAGVTPSPIYRHLNFELGDADVDALSVSGTLVLRDYSSEPWGIDATEDRFPGLWA